MANNSKKIPKMIILIQFFELERYIYGVIKDNWNIDFIKETLIITFSLLNILVSLDEKLFNIIKQTMLIFELNMVITYLEKTFY